MMVCVNDYKFAVDIIRDKYHRMRADYNDGKIVVHAYYTCSDDEINDFLKSKEKAIFQMIVREMRKDSIKDDVNILGNHYQIKPSTVNAIDDHFIYCNDSNNTINIIVSLFYKDLYNHLLQRTHYFYHLMYKENHVPTISLCNVKGYYGQYNKRDHHIKYNVCLMFNDLEIIDAIVVHELAHIRYMNHQKEFYDFVKLVLPNYKFLHDKLKKEGMTL